MFVDANGVWQDARATEHSAASAAGLLGRARARLSPPASLAGVSGGTEAGARAGLESAGLESPTLDSTGLSPRSPRSPRGPGAASAYDSKLLRLRELLAAHDPFVTGRVSRRDFDQAVARAGLLPSAPGERLGAGDDKVAYKAFIRREAQPYLPGEVSDGHAAVVDAALRRLVEAIQSRAAAADHDLAVPFVKLCDPQSLSGGAVERISLASLSCGLAALQFDLAPEEVRALLARFDRDGDGAVSLSDFSATVAATSAGRGAPALGDAARHVLFVAQRRGVALRALFAGARALYSASGLPFCSPGAFLSCVAQVAPELPAERAQALCAALDRDSDGRVSYAELLHACEPAERRRVWQLEERLRVLVRERERASGASAFKHFEVAAAGSSGRVDARAWRAGLDALALGASEADCDELFRRVNVGGSGQLAPGEFRVFVRDPEFVSQLERKLRKLVMGLVALGADGRLSSGAELSRVVRQAGLRDIEHGGCLDIHGVQRALLELGLDVPIEDVVRLVARLDAAGDDLVSPDDVAAFLDRLARLGRHALQMGDKLRALLRDRDAPLDLRAQLLGGGGGGDVGGVPGGVVPRAQFVRNLTAPELGMLPEHAARLADAFDFWPLVGGGLVDVEELLAFLLAGDKGTRFGLAWLPAGEPGSAPRSPRSPRSALGEPHPAAGLSLNPPTGHSLHATATRSPRSPHSPRSPVASSREAAEPRSPKSPHSPLSPLRRARQEQEAELSSSEGENKGRGFKGAAAVAKRGPRSSSLAVDVDSDSSGSSSGSPKSGASRRSASSGSSTGNAVLSDITVELQVLLSRAKERGTDYRKAFEHFDKDYSGEISAQQFREGLRELGFVLSGRQGRALFRRFQGGGGGGGGGGGLQYRAFLRAVVPSEEELHAEEASEKFRRLLRERAEHHGGGESGLRRTFRHFETDAQGRISRPSLRWGLAELRLELSDSEVRLLLDKLDADGDGRVSFDEFRAFATGADFSAGRQERLQGLRAVDAAAEELFLQLKALVRKAHSAGVDYRVSFEHFDPDYQGSLEAGDFRRGLERLGLAASNAEAHALARRFEGRDGRVRYRDFIRAVAPPEEATAEQVADKFRRLVARTGDVSRAFRHFERGRDGFVSRRALQRGMAQLDFKLTDSELRQVLDLLDVDADGKVSFDDFLAFVSGASGPGKAFARGDAGGEMDDADEDALIVRLHTLKLARHAGGLERVSLQFKLTQVPVVRSPPVALPDPAASAKQTVAIDFDARIALAKGSEARSGLRRALRHDKCELEIDLVGTTASGRSTLIGSAAIDIMNDVVRARRDLVDIEVGLSHQRQQGLVAKLSLTVRATDALHALLA